MQMLKTITLSMKWFKTTRQHWWWSVDYGLWIALADEDEVTIEFQWSDDDTYYLWGASEMAQSSLTPF